MQQLNVDRLLIPLLRAQLSGVVALLQEVAHHIHLHRLNTGIRAQLVVQLPGTAIVMR